MLIQPMSKFKSLITNMNTLINMFKVNWQNSHLSLKSNLQYLHLEQSSK